MILVTGATGKVGREVVKLLLADGKKVGAVTRSQAIAAPPGGADLVVGDPSRPKTLASVLRGVEALFLNPGTSATPRAGARDSTPARWSRRHSCSRSRSTRALGATTARLGGWLLFR